MANFEKHSGKILPPNVTVKKIFPSSLIYFVIFFLIFQNITLYTNIFFKFWHRIFIYFNTNKKMLTALLGEKKNGTICTDKYIVYKFTKTTF